MSYSPGLMLQAKLSGISGYRQISDYNKSVITFLIFDLFSLSDLLDFLAYYQLPLSDRGPPSGPLRVKRKREKFRQDIRAYLRFRLTSQHRTLQADQN